jgi:amino acid adenylation domain-containing protein
MNKLKERLSQLSPVKRALLEKMLEQKGMEIPVEHSIPKREGDTPPPLSLSQNRFWILEQLEPGTPMYNNPFAARITGEVDSAKLEKSINEIVRRHEALRATFASRGDHVVQVIVPSLFIPLPLLDIRYIDDSEKETESLRILVEESQQPFDLEKGPLVRARLVLWDAHDSILLMVTHHMVSDGWSKVIFFKELAALYDAFVEGKPSPLPELPIQYGDFSLWQHQQMHGLAPQLTYWKTQLNQCPVLDLPTVHPRPDVQTFRGRRYAFTVGKSLLGKLKNLSLLRGVTLFMVLLAVFKLLLFRYTHQTSIVVGSPISGRSRREIEGLIGFFVNTLPFKTELTGNLPFSELLTRVRETALEAYANQDYPFEKLVEELQPERDTSRSPLVQVLFQLRNFPDTDIFSSHLDFETVYFDTGIVTYELILEAEEKGGDLFCHFDFNIDLFDTAFIERLSGHFLRLLNGVVVDPEQCIGVLPLLAEVEQHQLLYEWNNTKKDYPQYLCIHQLFQQQVEKIPDNIAVIGTTPDEYGISITYRELDRKANRLARSLWDKGTAPGSIVGIMVERLVEMVVGIMAILKAGGAYMPIDPNYPENRINYMLADSSTGILLITRNLSKGTPYEKDVIYLEDYRKIAARTEKQPAKKYHDSQLAVSSKNTAYVIYTSGSTGNPRGTLIPHAAVVNRLYWMQKKYQFSRDDVVLHQTSFTFDVSVCELFRWILGGGRVCLLTPGGEKDPEEIVKAIDKNKITSIDFMPSMLELFLDFTAQEDMWNRLSSLRYVFTGVEPVSSKLIKTFNKNLNRRFNTKLMNLYGTTETTVDVTYFDCTDFEGSGSVPIGTPMDNVRVYIVDKDNNLQPPGLAGELWVSGESLARGYLNHPERTEEKFINDPFVEGQQVYKTGDLTRYRPDGVIEFLGRIDRQIKISGFRIEPGEIESVLREHMDVLDAVVIPLMRPEGDAYLAAYFVPAPERTPLVNELERFLKEKLPTYMVPATFVVLDHFPLTPNGKIDRKALPVQGTDRSFLNHQYTPPRNAMEAMITEIWGRALNLQRMGVHDNFFKLGGTSLLVTRVVSQLSKLLDVELSATEIFRAPTAAQLAVAVESALRPNRSDRKRRIKQADGTNKRPVSFSQARLWFLEQLEPNLPIYNIPMAFDIAGPLNVTALKHSLIEIINRHDILRTSFKVQEGEPVQVIAPELEIRLPIIDLSLLEETEQAGEYQRIEDGEIHCPFDLSKGPLLRVLLVRMAENHYILLITIHHIVFDGWSVTILVKELEGFYTAASAGITASLPPLPFQYADFAERQREWHRQEEFKKQLNYWTLQLEGSPSLLPLPTDRPRPEVQTYNGDNYHFTIPAETAEKLNELCRLRGVTGFMALLAVFNVLLHRYTGIMDMVVGIPTANRNLPEVDGLIGFFVNTLAIRTCLERTLPFKELLERVKKTCLDGYENQDFPFEQLVEHLQPERHLNRSPIFQTMVVFDVSPIEPCRFGGITLTPLDVHTRISKFDLTLFIEEGGGEWNGRMAYNTDLFNKDTIGRMVGHFLTLLAHAVDAPDTAIDALQVLTEPERRQLLFEFNDTIHQYPQFLCIHHLFQQQAEKSPDAAAVVWKELMISYSELNRRADGAAYYLRKQGVEPGMPVAICMERSIDIVVGILGILKAGAACLPIDPTYPQDRIAYIMKDSNARVLVSEVSEVSEVSWICGEKAYLFPEVINLNKISKDNENTPTHPLNHSTTQPTLAYIMYTSGSTGRPKGVAVSHRSVVRLLFGIDYVDLSGRPSILQMAPISFDASTFELWGALLHGGRCVLYPGNTIDMKVLGNVLQVYDIRVLWLTASLFNTIIDEVPEILTDVQQLLIGGETLSVPHVRRALECLPKTRIINGYGPTEGTTFTCCYPIPRTLPQNVSSIPIGRPISNTRVYILDSQLQPLPIGIFGELCIGGDGVALGYWNRPELTAEKFDRDFLDSQDDQDEKEKAEDFHHSTFIEPTHHSALYRTGDLARWLPDGTIEFLGRIDRQVKISGFRIEPGESESVLRTHPEVRDAVVLVREVNPGDQRLVAYYVTIDRDEEAVTIDFDDLKEFLEKKLPHFMIPSSYIKMDKFPLTPGGKVDINALSKPGSTSGAVDADGKYTLPRDRVEAELVKIWETLLHVKPVGITDDFFRLGGYSLLAIRLFHHIERQFGKKLPVSVLFQASTVKKLAAILREGEELSYRSSLVPIRSEGTKPPFFFMHHLDGGVLDYRELANRLDTDHSIYGIQTKIHEGVPLDYINIKEAAKYYTEVIKSVAENGPYLLGGHSFGGIVAIEVARQLLSQGEKVALVSVIDTRAPGTHLLPKKEIKMYYLRTYWERIKFHTARLFSMKGIKRWRYFLLKSNVVLGRMKKKWKRLYKRLKGIRSTFHQGDFKITKLLSESGFISDGYPGKVTLFKASISLPIYEQADYGWGKYAHRGVEVHEVQGEHGNLLKEPYAIELAEKLNQCIRDAFKKKEDV